MWMHHSSVERHLGCFIWGLSQIELIGTFVCRLLHGQKLLFLWDKCPGVSLLACRIVACLAFCRVAAPFYVSIRRHEWFCFSLCWPVLGIVTLIWAILIGVLWYLIVFLIWICLWLKMMNIFACAYLLISTAVSRVPLMSLWRGHDSQES